MQDVRARRRSAAHCAQRPGRTSDPGACTGDASATTARTADARQPKTGLRTDAHRVRAASSPRRAASRTNLEGPRTELRRARASLLPQHEQILRDASGVHLAFARAADVDLAAGFDERVRTLRDANCIVCDRVLPCVRYVQHERTAGLERFERLAD